MLGKLLSAVYILKKEEKKERKEEKERKEGKKEDEKEESSVVCRTTAHQ